MLKESDIKYELGDHWVFQKANGTFEVYKNGLTHSRRVAIIGFKGEVGLKRAIAECERREKGM